MRSYTFLFAILMPILLLAQGRDMRYLPQADGSIMCHNGSMKYTRALYGSHTLWRLETSDMPIFGAYHKKDNRNVHFIVSFKDNNLRLDSVADCKSYYKGGERHYVLSDPAWGKGMLSITAIALPDREGAIWRIKASNMPKGATLTANCCATAPVKMSRSGDLGVDPENCFDPHPDLVDLQQCKVGITGKDVEKYLIYIDRNVSSDDQMALYNEFDAALRYVQGLRSQIEINTPDPYINTLGPTLSAAADGIWDGETFQHGAVGWRMPLSGWRGAYAGDFLGWHDRARQHFIAYAASQVTDVPPSETHPSQDKANNLARAEKRWGTQMYSNGYICRNPRRNDQMHHYDMNLCYIDELLWHLQWTGDLEFAREIWPTIKLSLEWEKRNFDPDDDGLYDAYCCIWASDALYYDGGAVTHSSAYNYRANYLAAKIAQLLGEDSTPYIKESNLIYKAINDKLWSVDIGAWAEYQDRLGNQLVHDHPGLWTIYHAIDSDVSTPEQAYEATEYIVNNIPHIPIVFNDKPYDLRGEFAVISSTDWLPYSWSINNVAFGEMYHTALAFWQAGRRGEAFSLLKSAMIDGMFLGKSPGNIGQISHYDAARGECYRDFADPVGVLSRSVVQGLFGFTPNALDRNVTIQPGWPLDWNYAKISHPDFAIDFRRESSTDFYDLTLNIESVDSVTLILDALRDKVANVRVDGSEAPWHQVTNSVGRPRICVTLPARTHLNVEVQWDGMYISTPPILSPADESSFRDITQGDMHWLAPTTNVKKIHQVPTDAEMGVVMQGCSSDAYQQIPFDGLYNASITDIFKNEYLTPRSPYTTLQLPVQGIGEWCHPLDTAYVDDAALRASGGALMVENVPFATPSQGKNAIYVSMFDNYPTSVTIPLEGKAKAINFLMAGSTNHMQCYMVNAEVEVVYYDGSTTKLCLIPPYNWCPIEQDFYIDGKAFRNPLTKPLRLSLSTGEVSADLANVLGIDGVYGRRINGGGATILGMELDNTKTLRELRLKAVANDVVIGLLSATYVR